jgi:hypothetical protein
VHDHYAWLYGEHDFLNKSILSNMEQPKRAGQPWQHLVFGRDTDLQAAHVLVAAIRRQSFATRAEPVRSINRLVGQIAVAGARAQLPEAPVAVLAQDEVLAYLFGVSDSTVSRVIRRVLPRLERAGQDTMRL